MHGCTLSHAIFANLPGEFVRHPTRSRNNSNTSCLVNLISLFFWSTNETESRNTRYNTTHRTWSEDSCPSFTRCSEDICRILNRYAFCKNIHKRDTCFDCFERCGFARKWRRIYRRHRGLWKLRYGLSDSIEYRFPYNILPSFTWSDSAQNLRAVIHHSTSCFLSFFSSHTLDEDFCIVIK